MAAIVISHAHIEGLQHTVKRRNAVATDKLEVSEEEEEMKEEKEEKERRNANGIE